VHGWLEAARPVVYVLTDGSGHSAQSRLESTTSVLAGACAQPGTIYGRFTDVQLYAAILNKDADLFVDIAEEVAKALLSDGIHYVLGGSTNVYKQTHDICRIMIDTAVALVNKNSRYPVLNFEFPVVAAGNSFAGQRPEGATYLRLGDAAIDRKLAAAKSYTELRDDISKLISEMGAALLRFEELRPASSGTAGDLRVEEVPFYESYGEKQVSKGHYHRVIRYREHVLPISAALSAYVERHSLQSEPA